MDDCEIAHLRLIHLLPGRVRIHVPAWDAAAHTLLEARLRLLPGVREASYNPGTANLLVRFEPDRLSMPFLLSFLYLLHVEAAAERSPLANADLADLVADADGERAPAHPAQGVSPHERVEEVPDAPCTCGRSPTVPVHTRPVIGGDMPLRTMIVASGVRAGIQLLLRLLLGPEGAALALRLIAIGKVLLSGNACCPPVLRLALAVLGA